MKIKAILLVCVAIAALAFTKATTGEDIVKKMYSKYAGKWHKALVFKQTTERYRNDSLKSTQTWHEYMLAPDKLRIDIEPLDKGNSIIFRADSTYSIRNSKVVAARADENDLIFLLGGLYFYPLEKSTAKLKSLGYDLTKSYEDTYNGKPIYVIGASSKDDLSVNQLWVDKKDLYLVRMIKHEKQTKQDAQFTGHQKIGNGWTETKVHFYVNDKLLQVETYFDCKEAESLDEKMFDPASYVKGQ